MLLEGEIEKASMESADQVLVSEEQVRFQA